MEGGARTRRLEIRIPDSTNLEIQRPEIQIPEEGQVVACNRTTGDNRVRRAVAPQVLWLVVPQPTTALQEPYRAL